MADPFVLLTAENRVDTLAEELKNPDLMFSDRGSKEGQMVGRCGLEPGGLGK